MDKIRRFATRAITGVMLTFENKNGDRVAEEFTVVYRNYSSKNIDDYLQPLIDSVPDGGEIRYADWLGRFVVRIVDKDGDPITDETGEPADLSKGFFETIALEEARDMFERIQADIHPPKASPASGPSGLKAAASEA